MLNVAATATTLGIQTSRKLRSMTRQNVIAGVPAPVENLHSSFPSLEFNLGGTEVYQNLKINLELEVMVLPAGAVIVKT